MGVSKASLKKPFFEINDPIYDEEDAKGTHEKGAARISKGPIELLIPKIGTKVFEGLFSLFILLLPFFFRCELLFL